MVLSVHPAPRLMNRMVLAVPLLMGRHLPLLGVLTACARALAVVRVFRDSLLRTRTVTVSLPSTRRVN